MRYDIIIVGAGPGGIFAAYELMEQKPELKVAVFEAGHALAKRHCPIDGVKINSCIGCKSCSIMSGFGGAGAFSDGKYNITNDFGGTLYEYIGKKKALDLMHYVDAINLRHGGEGTKLYSTANSEIKRTCLENSLHLLDAQVRHLGTDINYIVLENLYKDLKNKVDFYFETAVESISVVDGGYEVRKVRHLRRPQRQQVDGGCVPQSQYPHQVQPRRYRCPRRTSRTYLQASDRRAL